MYKNPPSPLSQNDYKTSNNSNASRNHLYTYDTSPHNADTSNKQAILGNKLGQNMKFTPLSPNINKNPLSPTAKIKMFSQTLNLHQNNKNSPLISNL